tara:strand:+ start:1092 stop:1493 length:402 start_codon:yes stop_codon:yes gene_type:complete
MLSWTAIKDFTVESPPTYALGRLPEVEERYTRHCNQIKSSEYYKSIVDYIQKDVLGDKEYVFTENEFPYKVEDGIKHYLLWISKKAHGKYDPAKLISKRKEILESKEFTYYRNYKNNASIYEIEHYHVFAKYK